MMNNFANDLRYALRSLFKSPVHTAVAVLTLALGIGPTTVLFSAMGSILLRSLPFHEPEKLVWAWEVTPQGRRSTTSPANYLDWRQQSTSFSEMAAYDFLGFEVGDADPREMVTGAAVSANIFSVLGVHPAQGRGFLGEEERPGNHRVAVVSHGFWQRKLGGQPGVVGRNITLNNQTYAIIGVLPSNFWFFLDSLEVFVPIGWDAAILADRSSRGYDVIGRTRRGVSLEQAQQEINRIAAQIGATHGVTNAGWTVQLQPVQENYLAYFRPAMRVLLLAVGVVLAVACANVANMLLARGVGRRREYAIRVALGAGTGALTRMALMESVLLMTLGAGLAVWMVAWTRGALVAILPGELQRRLPGGVAGVGVDSSLVLVMGLTALAAGILAGLIPAWQATRTDAAESLRGTGAAAHGIPGRLRGGLVVWQVGFAAVALVLGWLLTLSYREVSRANVGFSAESLLRVGVSMNRLRNAPEAQRSALFERVLERASQVPGVEAAVLTNSLLPPPGAPGGPFVIDGRTALTPADLPTANVRLVSGDYFAKLGIPLLEGRSFTAADGLGAPGAVILSSAAATRYWPQGNALGQRIRFGNMQSEQPWQTVVGIAEDVRHPLDPRAAMIIYQPIAQAPPVSASLLVRTSRAPQEMQAAIESSIRSLDSHLSLWGVQPLAVVMAEELSHIRFTTILITLFAVITLSLAVLGVYGSSSYAVNQRTREFGVRLALGAQKGDIWRLVVRQEILPAAFGVALGVAAAWALTRVPWIAAQVHGISPGNALAFAGSWLVLAAASVAGCLWPARRAAQVDPLVALRHE